MKKHTFGYYVRNISTVVSFVLIWRGVWEILDKIDYALFGGSHIITAIFGIALGLYILYLPDHDLKEIEKM